VEGVTRIGFSDGVEIGVLHLYQVFQNVKPLELQGELLVEELLKGIKKHNWVAPSRERELGEIVSRSYHDFDWDD